MGETITGGCFCGAVRYKLRGKIMYSGICHCAACRKMGGGKGFAWFGATDDELELDGALHFYEYSADSGNTVRLGRCATCHAPVLNTNSAMPGVKAMAAGSLDDPSKFKPQVEVYAGSAPDWDNVDRSLECFEGMAPLPADD